MSQDYETVAKSLDHHHATMEQPEVVITTIYSKPSLLQMVEQMIISQGLHIVTPCHL